MSVWYCVPSKRPREESTLTKWRELGYKVCIAREEADGDADADKIYWVDEYLGWARSVNMLVKIAMKLDPAAEWFVTGGDDYIPDLAHKPEEIARECFDNFMSLGVWGTFGVMQPTGDRWQEGPCTTCGGTGIATDNECYQYCQDCRMSGRSAVIDRICGSPWMGREFCQRMYQGNGPLYEGYYHNFADEELQQVARKLGVLWQRRDLIHYHQHWARIRGDWKDAPAWADAINHPLHSDWALSKALFNKRLAAGFPGHEPRGTSMPATGLL